eukprot:CAMPEP_0115100136 /NCGR_PEP_ID=MMETSP0227-20121206/32338_1 /TAXON_ID=89957 /ORGANISM="Polarella glacialis, Strain CCMP 1383" /LENGTH=111 /DNA_ID=CAMNT_0002495401 /DNA_START=219 /DNA_END=554 /DNA_ORIENTATION=+
MSAAAANGALGDAAGSVAIGIVCVVIDRLTPFLAGLCTSSGSSGASSSTLVGTATGAASASTDEELSAGPAATPGAAESFAASSKVNRSDAGYCRRMEQPGSAHHAGGASG